MEFLGLRFWECGMGVENHLHNEVQTGMETRTGSLPFYTLGSFECLNRS